jgi:hypothetical protein
MCENTTPRGLQGSERTERSGQPLNPETRKGFATARTVAALYDKLHISHDGYAGAVPIVHKSAAVSEVIAQLAIEADEDSE